MKIARWLLERFGADEALVGDIEEERTGRSVWWLARQVSVAVARTTLRQWRMHPWLALRAIVVGWLCTVAAGFAATGLMSTVRGPFAAIYVLAAASNFFAPFAGGWAVARMHPLQPMAMVLCFCVSLLLPLEMLILWKWQTPMYVPFRWEMLYRTALIMLGALAGGLLLPAARRRSTAAPPA